MALKATLHGRKRGRPSLHPTLRNHGANNPMAVSVPDRRNADVTHICRKRKRRGLRGCRGRGVMARHPSAPCIHGAGLGALAAALHCRPAGRRVVGDPTIRLQSTVLSLFLALCLTGIAKEGWCRASSHCELCIVCTGICTCSKLSMMT